MTETVRNQSEQMSDEEFVRGKWEFTHRCDGSYRHYAAGTILIQDTHGHWLDFDSWSSARAFTEHRLEEIRKIEEEIKTLHPFRDGRTQKALERMPGFALDMIPSLLAAGEAIQRTIDRLEREYDNLKRGMK